MIISLIHNVQDQTGPFISNNHDESIWHKYWPGARSPNPLLLLFSHTSSCGVFYDPAATVAYLDTNHGKYILLTKWYCFWLRVNPSKRLPQLLERLWLRSANTDLVQKQNTTFLTCMFISAPVLHYCSSIITIISYLHRVTTKHSSSEDGTQWKSSKLQSQSFVRT